MAWGNMVCNNGSEGEWLGGTWCATTAVRGSGLGGHGVVMLCVVVFMCDVASVMCTRRLIQLFVHE